MFIEKERSGIKLTIEISESEWKEIVEEYKNWDSEDNDEDEENYTEVWAFIAKIVNAKEARR